MSVLGGGGGWGQGEYSESVVDGGTARLKSLTMLTHRLTARVAGVPGGEEGAGGGVGGASSPVRKRAMDIDARLPMPLPHLLRLAPSVLM